MQYDFFGDSFLEVSLVHRPDILRTNVNTLEKRSTLNILSVDISRKFEKKLSVHHINDEWGWIYCPPIDFRIHTTRQPKIHTFDHSCGSLTK